MNNSKYRKPSIQDYYQYTIALKLIIFQIFIFLFPIFTSIMTKTLYISVSSIARYTYIRIFSTWWRFLVLFKNDSKSFFKYTTGDVLNNDRISDRQLICPVKRTRVYTKGWHFQWVQIVLLNSLIYFSTLMRLTLQMV